MLARFRTTVRALFRRNAWERDLEDELLLHIDQRAADLVRTGLAPHEAERRARLELGFRETYKEECRQSFGLRRFDELRQDLHYHLRVLRRNPGLMAIPILSLALGIGVNTTVFSVLNTIVLKPLPVASPDSLRFVETARTVNHSFPNYRDLRDRNTTFSDLVGYRVAPMALENGGVPRRVWGYLATGNYFDALGIQPAAGRFFHPEEDQAAGAYPVAVVSYDYWQSQLSGDPGIAGRTFRINGYPITIVGVAPRGFHGTELFYTPDIWVPFAMQQQVEGSDKRGERGNSGMWVFGRLRPGISAQRAEAELNSISADLSRTYPKLDEGLQISLGKLGLYGNTIRSSVQAFLFVVMALAGILLLATCANLASQLSARAADRHFELAVRLSIGAGRTRIFRQLITESMLMALLGGAAGLALAWFLLEALAKWRRPFDLPLVFEAAPDLRVFLFVFVVCLLAGLFFGVVPARHSLRADPNLALRGMPAGNWASRRWSFRDLLLAGQIAVCGLLVTASFVSIQGMARSLRTPIGLRPEGAFVANFDLGVARYSKETGRTLQRRAVEEIESHPGVTSAAYANSVPLAPNQSRTAVFAEGTTDFRASEAIRTYYYDVSPGYFRSVGTRLVAGRDFAWRDDAKSTQVAIVNQTLAKALAGAADPVGRRFWYGAKDPVEIVGVVEDGKYEMLTEPPRPAMFRAAEQAYNSPTILIVRSNLPEAVVIQDLARTIRQLDPELPLYAPGSLAGLQAFAFFPSRAAVASLVAFGVLAVMLALTGVYGLAAYTVSRRVREIGIRVAVGARPWDIVRSVLGRTAVVLSAGSVAGLLSGVGAARLLSSVVLGASPKDPVVLGAVSITMFTVGLAAAWVPARRAMSVDPIRSLRTE